MLDEVVVVHLLPRSVGGQLHPRYLSGVGDDGVLPSALARLRRLQHGAERERKRKRKREHDRERDGILLLVRASENSLTFRPVRRGSSPSISDH